MSGAKDGSKISTYGTLLATYAGFSILFTWLRYAEWYDACTLLNCGLPFYFSYLDAAVRGGVSGLAVTIVSLVTIHRYVECSSSQPARGASLILVGYIAAIGLSLVTTGAALDPGLLLYLLAIGIVAASSTFLHGSSLVLANEKPLSDRERHIKRTELEHKETTDMISSLMWLIIATCAVMAYNYYGTFWQYLYGRYGFTNYLVWRTFTLDVVWFSLFALGLTWFTMAPLFRRLEIVKQKL